jgi:glycosyltransferase involved in cell wall biosynthesis
MALLEAQAAGIPVVSCALRGVPDVVRDGHTGLLAPGGDEAALARLLQRMLEDAGSRERMGRAAAGFVAGERSLPAAASQLDQALMRASRRAGSA